MSQLKILIIVNGISRKKKKFYSEILPALQKKFEIVVAETAYAGHASPLAAEAMNKNYDCIIAAGGDGTLHQVVNGVLNARTSHSLPFLGLIPLGSGNDFATTCGLSCDDSTIGKLLLANKPKPIDIGKISCFDAEGNKIEKYFINACSLGMGPATVQRMEKSPKWFGSDIRYLTSIIHTFFTHRPQDLTIKTNSWEWRGKLRAFAITNGKSFGNKIFIAPDALQDDGWFNSFLVSEIALPKFLWYLQLIKQKKKIADNNIKYDKLCEAQLSSTEKVMIEAEGELVGYLPASILVMPFKINFFC
jgi:diacylglycerol kinase (ATP)